MTTYYAAVRTVAIWPLCTRTCVTYFYWL